ncbi:MAG: hypothetical protein ABI321_00960 [Polyangia bacterium]
MILTSVAPLLPVALAAVALGRSLVENIGSEGRKKGARELAVLIALGSIALFLCGLGVVTVRERACVAACGGALWLVGRAARDARLTLLVVCALTLLLGAEPRAGIAFAPALVLVAGRALGGHDTKLKQRMGLLFVVALVLGYVLAGRGAARLVLPDADAMRRWFDGALRATGPIALAFAFAGVLLALTGEQSRRGAALIAVLAIAADAAGGHFTATSSFFVALCVGLGLLEVGAHLGRSPVRGVRLALAPLLALVLVEPVGLRVENARLSWPTLGPVPPAVLSVPRVVRR